MKTNLLFLAIVALLFTAADAQAESWSMPNQAGGQIVLSERACARPGNVAGSLEAYAYTRTGVRQSGCWTAVDGLIQITWWNGQRSVFDSSNFVTQPEHPTPVVPARHL